MKQAFTIFFAGRSQFSSQYEISNLYIKKERADFINHQLFPFSLLTPTTYNTSFQY